MIGKEPIVESTLCKQILSDNYDQICRKILETTRYAAMTKMNFIQNSLLNILPKLAAFRKQLFLKYLNDTMLFMDKLVQVTQIGRNVGSYPIKT